jgi:hypothetical protein
VAMKASFIIMCIAKIALFGGNTQLMEMDYSS